MIYIETYTLSEPSDEKALLQTARCIGRTLRQQEPAKVTDIPFARVYYTSDLSVTTMGQTLYDILWIWATDLSFKSFGEGSGSQT